MALAKAAASAVVLASGFRAVSDDDFARVVIAEQWARSPRWDASGTSWLPLPFWICGAAMKLSGRGLDTARGVALVLGVIAALLVYAAARWMGEGRGPAAAGAVVAAVFPWSARLGVATVPELITAALTLLAMAAVSPPSPPPRRLLVGGVALFGATLSRYEAWPVALIFAAVCVSGASRPGAARGARVTAAAAALAGPAVWLCWNRARHGDALHFLARVAAYRQALGDSGGGAPGRLLGYPLAMVRQEPEIAVLLAVAALVTLAVAGVRELRARLLPYARPAAMAGAQIAALSLAMLKDGAPTHHPERAVLAALLLIAVAGGALSAHLLQANGALGARVLGAGGLAGAVVLAAAFGRGVPHEGFVQRAGEEAIGRALATSAAPGEPVLVEVVDYGYLAVQAALGRPEDTVPDRSVDPRDTKTASSFADVSALRRRVEASGARWVVARPNEPVVAVLGAPRVERGGWAAFAVEARP